VVVGWFTRLLYDLAIPAKCLIPGSSARSWATTYSCG